MIVINKDVVANVYNYLITRPFHEVANIVTALHNEIDHQFKALEQKVGLEEAPVAPSETEQVAPSNAPVAQDAPDGDTATPAA